MRKIYACLLIEPNEACALEIERAAAGRSTVKASRPVSHFGRRPLAQRSFSGQPLIDWVVRRASEAQQLDGVLVVLPQTTTMEEFRQLLPSDVRVIQSSPHSAGKDRLSRLREAVESLSGDAPARSPAPARGTSSTHDTGGLDGIVMLRLDCPLLDPYLLDRLVNAVREEPWVDYATFHSVRDSVDDRLRALLQTQLGLFVEYFGVEALRKLDERLTNRAERDRFEGQVSAYSDEFKLRLLALPTALDRGDLRFSLRHQDDWAHAEQIVEALGDERLEWQRLVDLLQRQPEWRDRMASLNRAEYAT